MNQSYIATNQEELFDKASPEIQQMILGGEVSTATMILGKKYTLPINSHLALSNIISFTLIGALEPDNVVVALSDMLTLSAGDAYALAEDLEKSIFQKARITVLKKSGEDMVTLTFEKTASEDELRKEILDTTKRESGFVKDQSEKNPVPAQPKETAVLAAGSRSQLLEQLQILDSIPNDEEINSRLDHIKEQISLLDKKEGNSLDSNIALQEFMFGEEGSSAVEAEPQTASYSKAPTKYNIDPYRELTEGS